MHTNYVGHESWLMIRNKLASLEAKLVRNYDRVTLLTGVKCRATSVAKKLWRKISVVRRNLILDTKIVFVVENLYFLVKNWQFWMEKYLVMYGFKFGSWISAPGLGGIQHHWMHQALLLTLIIDPLPLLSQSQTIWSNQVCTWHFLSYLSTSHRSLSNQIYLYLSGCIKCLPSHKSIIMVITSLPKYLSAPPISLL